MLGIVIVAHSELAQSYIDAVSEMMGTQHQLEAVSYHVGDDLEVTRAAIATAIAEVDRERGVIIVTDMFGGTPCNLSISVAESRKIEVISGLNLAMLLKMLSSRDVLPLAQVVSEAKQAGIKYINVLSEIMEQAAAG